MRAHNPSCDWFSSWVYTASPPLIGSGEKGSVGALCPYALHLLLSSPGEALSSLNTFNVFERYGRLPATDRPLLP
eukprot:270110-Prorocentrum_minimum.AAC.1